jgi:hypothetical protein
MFLIFEKEAYEITYLYMSEETAIHRQQFMKLVLSFLFPIYTRTFSGLCKKNIQWYVEECSIVLLCN